MKKIIMTLAALVMVAGAAAFAQAPVEISKKDMNTINKTAKKLAKEKVRDGWQLVESTTMEEAIKEVLIAKKKGCQEIVGTAFGKRDMVVAKTGARNAAINEYIEYSKSMVTARINTEVTDLTGEETNNLVTGYERLVVKEIDGEIRPAFTMYKQNKGSIDMESHFIIDVDAAAVAREKAFKQAVKEAELAAKFGDVVSNFVHDGFDSEKTIGE